MTWPGHANRNALNTNSNRTIFSALLRAPYTCTHVREFGADKHTNAYINIINREYLAKQDWNLAAMTGNPVPLFCHAPRQIRSSLQTIFIRRQGGPLLINFLIGLERVLLLQNRHIMRIYQRCAHENTLSHHQH